MGEIAAGIPAIAPRVDERRAAQVRTLLTALPWMQRYAGEVVVVKFGGHAMVDSALMTAFAQDIAFMRYSGIRIVIVHGGGPHITRMLDRLGIPNEFRAGYRYTSSEAMEIVRMVLGGQVARELVAAINEVAPIALGTSGEDAGLFEARRKRLDSSGAPIDLGYVGDIIRVNPAGVITDLDAGRIPVVSSIASDVEHPRKALNINADMAAAALAARLGAAKLVILTDVDGIYARWPDPDSVISNISVPELRAMLPKLATGMIPKVEACIEAVESGVDHATIIDGRVPHSMLLEIFTPEGHGTMIRAD